MKIRSTLLLLLIGLQSFGQTRDSDAKVLFSIAGRNITAGEFKRMYEKSSSLQGEENPDEYLKHFIVFKQKVADAISEGIDTTKAFRNELNGYRKQLAQSYLTDQNTRSELLKKAYQRYLIDIKAHHILVSCPEGANPEDTLAAWKKATDIRERILLGEQFEQVAKSASDDPSARINGGNLGYFTVFQMIMPFEDAAYNMKKGQISHPVRSSYGYHIIKVDDIRKSAGKVRVAHIMKVTPPGSHDTLIRNAEKEINVLYNELLRGTSFKHLAGLYSDHKESATSGGLLNWFGTGEITHEFAEAAFSLKDTGSFSKPVRTTYGWHIIKLVDKKAPGSFDEMKSWLESRINQSYLNSLSQKNFVEKLKKEHNLKISTKSVEWFTINTDTLIIRGEARYPASQIPEGTICTFTGNQITNREFADYVLNYGYKVITNDPAFFIKELLNSLISEKLTGYENSILEKKYPEFGYLMNEFHDGILLFEISGRRVWNKVTEDTTGLKDFYERNKDRFLSPRLMEATVYRLSDMKQEKKLLPAYKKYSTKKNGDLLMINKFISNNDTLLTIKETKWKEGDQQLPAAIEWKPGVYKTVSGTTPQLIVVHRIIEPAPLPLEEVKAEMLQGYQEELESKWLLQLNKSYPVNVDMAVFEEIKNRLNDE